MSFFDRYIDDSRGRTFILAFLVALLLASLNIVLALQDPALTMIGWLYREEIESTDINWLLVGISVVLLWITYLMIVIAFANRKELNGGLPSWEDLFIPAVIVILFGVFISNLTIQGGQTGAVEGFSNFSGRMRWVSLLINLMGILLIMIYIYFANPTQEVSTSPKKTVKAK
jgi:hypothetical protein